MLKMAKRFTDTEIWKKEWFLELSPSMKCFWKYITDNCNHAGIWELNLKLASFSIGSKVTIEDIEKNFSDKIVFIDKSKIFIPKFIMFQYKVNDFSELNELNRVHKSALDLINKYDLLDPSKTLHSPLIGVKDMDKDKDKDKNSIVVKIPFVEIVEYSNENMEGWPQVKTPNGKGIQTAIKSGWNSGLIDKSLDGVIEYLNGIKNNLWLMGQMKGRCLEWFMKASNMEKVLNGKYIDCYDYKKQDRHEQPIRTKPKTQSIDYSQFTEKLKPENIKISQDIFDKWFSDMIYSIHGNECAVLFTSKPSKDFIFEHYKKEFDEFFTWPDMKYFIDER